MRHRVQLRAKFPEKRHLPAQCRNQISGIAEVINIWAKTENICSVTIAYYACKVWVSEYACMLRSARPILHFFRVFWGEHRSMCHIRKLAILCVFVLFIMCVFDLCNQNSKIQPTRRSAKNVDFVWKIHISIVNRSFGDFRAKSDISPSEASNSVSVPTMSISTYLRQNNRVFACPHHCSVSASEISGRSIPDSLYRLPISSMLCMRCFV
jgi:hypothetical protein